MARGDEFDLTAPFRDLVRASRETRTRRGMARMEVEIRKRITVDIGKARELGITLAEELKDAARAELESGKLGVTDSATIERRERTIRRKDGRFRSHTLRDRERYPAGYRPNTASRVFGIDSGYLRDRIQAREDGKRTGRAVVVLPANRSRAAYVRRTRVLDPSTKEYRTVFNRTVDGVVTQMIKVNGKARKVRR